jgi:hypothetical protein
MNFNTHSGLEGAHSFLAASKHHWTNYSIEKLDQTYLNHLATQKGVELHALAAELIRLKVRLPGRTKIALNNYVNDAIGFNMKTEQVLYYSPSAFATTDAICFRDNILRIHDLKTGVSRVSMSQLEIYAAYFCLEYMHDPNNIEMELRIYQTDQPVQIYHPEGRDILAIMDTIVQFDKRIQKINSEMED